MNSRKQSLAEAVVIQVAIVVEIEGVAKVATTQGPKTDTVNSPLTDVANVLIVVHHINQGNAQPMVKPATTEARVVIMANTAVQHSTHPLQGNIHDMEQIEDFGPNC